MSIFVICLFLGSSALSFPHSSNNFFRIGNLRRFSELADPPDFNSVLPIPNSFGLMFGGHGVALAAFLVCGLVYNDKVSEMKLNQAKEEIVHAIDHYEAKGIPVQQAK